MFHTPATSITHKVSQEKWDKTKTLIAEALSWFGPNNSDPVLLNFKRLEQIRVFLCHISMTYERVTPFLKGFHLTLCKYLPNRNHEGWKLGDNIYASYLHNLKDKGLIDDDTLLECLNPAPFHNLSPPLKTEASFRLYDDLKVLRAMFQSALAIEVTLRSTHLLYLLYGFCDASGKGLGSTMMSNEGIWFRVGL